MVSKFAITFKIIPPLRDIAKRFTVAEQQLPENIRNEMRVEGRRLTDLVVAEAPKATGKFASKISFRTYSTSKTTGFSVFLPQPIGSYIIEGTKPHTIAAKRSGALSFFWSAGPSGPGRYAFKSVFHPGTKPNKFTGRAFRRWMPGARGSLERISNRYVRTIAGSGTRSGTF